MSTIQQPSPITVSSTTTTNTTNTTEPKKKVSRVKKNATSNTTTTNTTTITITPKFIEVPDGDVSEDQYEGILRASIGAVVGGGERSTDLKNHIISSNNVSSGTSSTTKYVDKNMLDNEEHKSEYDSESEPDSEEESETNRTPLRSHSYTLSSNNNNNNNNNEDDDDLYKLTRFSHDLLIPFNLINMHASSRSNILALLHTTLIYCIVGRCISEGFIKPETVRIVEFKCGI